MIIYILLGISVILLLSIIYIFYSNNKGKHRLGFKSKSIEDNNKENSSSPVHILSKEYLKDKRDLKELIIEEDVSIIEDKCFINSPALASISVSEENKSYCSKLGVLFTKDMKKIVFYPPNKKTSTYFIPQGVESINTHAFFNNSFLKYVIIPTSLNYIGENSFVNCKFINQVVIPESVTEIHPNAFSLCPRITIRCYKNSAAEDFCKKYFIPYELLTEEIK